MAKKEFKIGETFQCGLVKLRVETPESGLCKGCFFGSRSYDCGSIINLTGSCYFDEREDNTNVIFVKVEE